MLISVFCAPSVVRSGDVCLLRVLPYFVCCAFFFAIAFCDFPPSRFFVVTYGSVYFLGSLYGYSVVYYFLLTIGPPGSNSYNFLFSWFFGAGVDGVVDGHIATVFFADLVCTCQLTWAVSFPLFFASCCMCAALVHIPSGEELPAAFRELASVSFLVFSLPRSPFVHKIIALLVVVLYAPVPVWSGVYLVGGFSLHFPRPSHCL